MELQMIFKNYTAKISDAFNRNRPAIKRTIIYGTEQATATLSVASGAFAIYEKIYPLGLCLIGSGLAIEYFSTHPIGRTELT